MARNTKSKTTGQKKSTAQKTTVKAAAASKTVAEKTEKVISAKETAPVKEAAPVQDTTAKAAPTEKKAPVKETAAKTTSAEKKAPAKDAAPVKKAPVKETTAKTTSAEKKAPAKEAAPVKETAAKTTSAEKKAPAKEAAPVKETAAKEEKAVKQEETKAAPAKETAPTEKKAPVKETATKTTSAEKKAPAKEAAPEKKAPVKETAAKEEKAVKQEETKAAPAKKASPEKKAPVKETAAKEEKAVKQEETKAAPVKEEEPVAEEPTAKEPEVVTYDTPRRSIAFIGSECYPFVKTGGLGDVMYALPKALVKQNCDVKVILPRYKCIPWKYQEKMEYRGAFQMDLCADGKSFYVGIMEYVWDGVVYDFIDNEEFFSNGNPYTNLIDDIPKYCYFAKAALAALNYLDWIPDIIHCHDWQAALVPVYLRTLFEDTKLSKAKTILTIHNLRFQGVYNIPTIRYWSGLPDYVFNKDALKEGYEDANMLKGGLTYCNVITTVSNTYAGEIQTGYYGEHLDAHLRYHSGKLRGIVNGIDYDIWNPATDENLYANYDITNVLEKKKENKRKLQEELGLVQDDHKIVIGLISRLTDQKGLDLVNAIIPQIMDEHTQLVVLGTGEPVYEDSFRYYENAYKGNVCSNIMYDEARSHKIYAGADAFLVPSQFEPCGLTQLIAMHYGTVPIVRETGGLKDTVEPYNKFYNTGNGFTFDRYDAGLLLDAINRAKTLYFTDRWKWDEMVQRNMDKDFSWDNSAKQYKNLYLELTW